MPGKTAVDSRGVALQVFLPTEGKQIPIGTYSPTEETEVVKLGNAVNISINGESVPYTAGEVIALSKDVTYTFDAITVLHVM